MDLNFSVGGAADVVVNYILDHFTPALDIIAATIGFVTDGIQNALIAIPPVAGVAILTLLALWRVGWKFAIFTLLALALIIHMELWSGTMESLSLVLASTVIAVVSGVGLIFARLGDGVWDVMSWLAVGLPLGVAAWVWSRTIERPRSG